MKRLFYLVGITAAAVTFGACAKSVEKAQRDVDRAHDQAVRNVQEEQKDLRETQRDANERIARQERRVEDAAREGNEKIIQEKRELEDAKRDEARRDNNTITPAPIPDRTSTDNDRPGRVDVNVNRGPGGVNVDVNRNP
jgi:hypothetical protein